MKNDEIVTYALSCVGKSRDEVGCSGTHAWCANFVSNVLRYVGITNMYDLSCTSMRNRMDASPEWDEPETMPVPGDPIFFEWDGDGGGDCDHIGIVVAVNGNTITYVNGNGSSSTHVTKQSIDINSRFIAYWMRYVGDGTNDAENATAETSVSVPVSMPVIKIGSKGCAVKTMQVLLVFKFNYPLPKYGCDSDFGSESNAALKRFQSDKGLVSDGICGAKTWEALLK